MSVAGIDAAGLVFVLALCLAALNWVAVARRARRLEYVFKPAALCAILLGAGLLARGPHDPWQTPFFMAGLALSLVGDVLLMLPGEHFFLPGLAAFWLAHVGYIVGLNATWPPWPALAWLLPVVVGLGALLYRRVAAALRHGGRTQLLVPVALYTFVLGFMLLSAWATLFRPEWTAARRALVISGGTLFAASDTLLAWNRFVRPWPQAPWQVMVTYHLAQIALALSIAV